MSQLWFNAQLGLKNAIPQLYYIDQLDHRSLSEPFHVIKLTGKRPMKRSLAMISSSGILTVVVFPLPGVPARGTHRQPPRRGFDRDLLHDEIEVLHSLTYLTDRCFSLELHVPGQVWRLHRDFDNAVCLIDR